MYSEHAGTRSDYIIVGHPAFQHGKVRTDNRGMPSGWDDKGVPSHPAKNMAKTRSTCTLVGELTCTDKRATLKDRALARTWSAGSVTPKSTIMLRDDFNGFLDVLKDNNTKPRKGMERSLTEAAKSLGWSAVCRHFGNMDEEMQELRSRYKRNPDNVARELQQTGSWKYYALHVEQARKLEAQFEREKKTLPIKA
eukprot:CAMPEP_0206422386 /NCGR_PEP_ID=MMETSP0324_2-20121206/2046_1 /ASSEMBLY_ACC=CAM_ASM_000836 /TAXON_ID=2866 /ORGANISM="Crypthecodinium cohnii, Strain Seligo" /LENGTH=194 /DNA_ID=CAMNT_0053886729 /DNA_START=296 /DNA_END=880 /DNA_ORIENTATION=+